MAMIGSVCAQEGGLKTAAAVLDRYKEALGGADVIKKVQSETVRGEIESSSMKGKAVSPRRERYAARRGRQRC